MNVTDPQGRLGWPLWRHALIVVLVWAAVYLPRLGAGGLTSTEGHRAIPGWEMLENGHWTLPRLFGQVYLRKPPGVSWAIAGASAVLGETELAARLPSALAMLGMSLTAMFFGAKWFGRKYGIVAGLGTALTPLFWSTGRSAEIEAINNFATCASVLILLDLLISRGRTATAKAGGSVVLVLVLTAAALAKGPAGFAAIGSAAAVGLVLGRVRPGKASEKRLLWPLASFIVAGLTVGLLAGAISRVVQTYTHETGQQPITQGVTEFLWGGQALTAAAIGRVLAMAPIALASALPVSLALLFPWGPGARGEAPRDDDNALALRYGRALAWTCLLSLAFLTVLGVNNPRYAMPSLSFLPVLAAYVWRGLDGGFDAARTRIAVWMTLGVRWGWAAALLAAAAVFIFAVEPRHRSTSGRDAGVSLGAVLPDGAMVWADHMIEARPEVLWYARQTAAQQNRTVRPVWVPGMASTLSLPRQGVYLLLRTDPESDEEAAYREKGFMDRLEKVWSGKVHKFECALYRMHPVPARAP